MSQTLYVRLHREANVPGERCDWILRARSGAELRRGRDPLDRMPKAPTNVGVLSQDMVFTRAVRLPPGRRARASTALASAIEPYLLSEPAANHVIALGDDATGTTAIAAVARAWLDSCVGALRASGHPPTKLIVESDLVPRAADAWTAICHTDGGLLCAGGRHAETLDACAPGAAPEVLRLRIQAAGASQPRSLVVFADDGVGLDPKRWTQTLGMDIDPRGPWDWALATAPEHGFRIADCADLLPRVDAEPGGGMSVRRWRVALYLAAGTLLLHTGATVVWWSQRNAERNALNDRIVTAFQHAVGPKEPLVDAGIQTGRALDQARRSAGEYATGDFMSLLARVTSLAVTAELSATALKSLQYAPDSLVLEWENVPGGSLERVVAELKAQGLRADVTRQGARSTLTLRTTP